MRYFSIILILALLVTAARAQLTTTGIGKVAGGGAPPADNCILADTGNNLLADVGNCILVQ